MNNLANYKYNGISQNLTYVIVLKTNYFSWIMIYLLHVLLKRISYEE
jgi:hypothetical protein